MTTPRNNRLMRLPRQFNLPVLAMVTANNSQWEFTLDDTDHLMSSAQLRTKLADEGISDYYIVYVQLEDLHPTTKDGVLQQYMPHRFIARVQKGPERYTGADLDEVFRAMVYVLKNEVDTILDLDEAAETFPHVGRVFVNDRSNHPRATTANAHFLRN